MKTIIISIYAVVFGMPHIIIKSTPAHIKYKCEHRASACKKLKTQNRPEKKTGNISYYDNIFYKIF